MLQGLSPHYLSTSCSSIICTLLRSSCSSLVVLGDHTEELSLCRAVCITSVINWILPRADFVEYFFLLFLRLDHLRSNLLGPPFYEQLQMLREIKYFPQFPIITQWFCSPQFYHSILSKTPILIFLSLSWEAIFSISFLLPSASFIFWELVKQSSALGDKPAPLLPFTVSVLDIIWVFGRALIIWGFFLQVDGEKDGRVLLK